MKKNIFALSVAAALAGFAGSAAAQGVPFVKAEGNVAAAEVAATEFAVNAGGVGHVLLTPYYTVQGARNTLLNIVNTDTKNGKAVKVRFRGARNSDDVFDFYVFLSPGDVWRSRVYTKDGQTRLDVPDSSCTLPSRDVVNATPFKTDRVYDGKDVAETREGYVEFLTAADIPEGSALYKTIKHHFVTGAVECDLEQLVKSTVRLTTAQAAKDNGLYFPSAGLVGHWAVVDVSKNTAVSGNNTALLAVKDGAAALGNIVIAPQDAELVPDSWVDGPTAGTTDPLLTTKAVLPVNVDFPDLSTPYVHYAATKAPATNDAGHQANELSAALAVKSIMNEFATGQGVDLKTDWVFSLPTRRYGVAIDYQASGAARFVKNPQSAFFGAENVTLGKGAIPHLEIRLNASYYDSNERGLLPVISPVGTGQRIAGEVNVLTFNGNPADSVLGAQISAQSLSPMLGLESITDGWGTIKLDNKRAALTSNHADYQKLGTPVIGYATFTAGSAALGFTWPHRFSR